MIPAPTSGPRSNLTTADTEESNKLIQSKSPVLPQRTGAIPRESFVALSLKVFGSSSASRCPLREKVFEDFLHGRAFECILPRANLLQTRARIARGGTHRNCLAPLSDPPTLLLPAKTPTPASC